MSNAFINPCHYCGVRVYDDDINSVTYETSGIVHTCFPETDGEMYIEEVQNLKENKMKNTIKVISKSSRGFSANSLGIGEYGRIVGDSNIDSHVGDVVLKAAALVVNLTNPSKVWSSPFDAPLVERLKTDEKIEITIGFTQEV